MSTLKRLVFLFACVFSHAVLAQNVATLRQHDIDKEPKAPAMQKVENNDVKRKRNYPMQPPTIPHKIDQYQVDLRTNKCMSCHSRVRTSETQAPMVSVTHFMNRDGNFLAEISPRRYFCLQCHVVQTDAKALVGNTFQDMDEIAKKARKAKP